MCASHNFGHIQSIPGQDKLFVTLMLTHCLCAWWTIQAGVLLVGSTAFSIVYLLIHSLVRNMPIIKTSVVRLKSPFLVSDFYFTFFLFSLHLVSATNFLNASPSLIDDHLKYILRNTCGALLS